MKDVMYKIIVGCYIVAALVLVTACNDGLDIQQAYPFTVETLPIPKKLKVGETAEIRCQLVRGGDYQPTTYQIRYFQPDGKGKLEMDNGTVFLPMTFTRWRKKHSCSITHRHRPTSRRLTSISSTASGRCSRFRSRSIMTITENNKSFIINKLKTHPIISCVVFFCNFAALIFLIL